MITIWEYITGIDKPRKRMSKPPPTRSPRINETFRQDSIGSTFIAGVEIASYNQRKRVGSRKSVQYLGLRFALAHCTRYAGRCWQKITFPTDIDGMNVDKRNQLRSKRHLKYLGSSHPFTGQVGSYRTQRITADSTHTPRCRLNIECLIGVNSPQIKPDSLRTC